MYNSVWSWVFRVNKIFTIVKIFTTEHKSPDLFSSLSHQPFLDCQTDAHVAFSMKTFFQFFILMCWGTNQIKPTYL